MKKIISIYGLAAAGKTTQAEILCREYGFRQFGMGDTLREEIASGSALGQEIKKSVDQGVLIPDELMCQVLKKIGSDIKDSGIVFDGFPRMLPQADMLDKILGELGLKLDILILLDIDYQEAERRIAARAALTGRADYQNKEVVNNRLEIFRRESEPIIARYQQEGRFARIDGTKSIEEVTAEIKKLIA